MLDTDNGKGKKALKVFRSRFVDPSLVHETEQIVKFAGMTGLAASQRSVLSPRNHPELLAQEPDLLYGVVMPWIDGPTWMDIMLNASRLTRRQSYTAAYTLTEILLTMEQRGIAHCDLSGPNVMLPLLNAQKKSVHAKDYVQLIDLEQMYASHFEQPSHMPGGSPGYSPQYAAHTNTWHGQADRFAGAILIMEMLGSCTDAFFKHAWGESYFDPDEMQRYGERVDLLSEAIRPVWGDELAELFARAWTSEEIAQCPAFGEWMMALSKIDTSDLAEGSNLTSDLSATANLTSPASNAGATAVKSQQQTAAASETASDIQAVLRKARKHEGKGNWKRALSLYQSAYAQQPHASVAKEIEIAIEHAEHEMKKQQREKLSVVPKLIMGQLRKYFIIVLVIGVLGAGGFYGYKYVKNMMNKPDKQTEARTNAEIMELKEQLAQRDKDIEQLKKQLEEQSKPYEQKRFDLIGQLSTDYEEIRKIATEHSDETEHVERLTYEAAGQYLQNLYNFLQTTYSLDAYTMEQLHIVEGYYYPFQYNHERNAQLNLQFFESYQDKFDPNYTMEGDSP